MIIVTGVIELESVAELERVKSALIRRANKSRVDAGNIEYVFSVSLENPLQIRLVETWESEVLLDAHLMVPDEEFNDLIATAKITLATVDMHEVSVSRELLRL
ncbi:MAG: quinol monooxygenase YgiN [Candidatus Azotimanducaceae bacterium]|jgi:quinol monooxygenase YgiN